MSDLIKRVDSFSLNFDEIKESIDSLKSQIDNISILQNDFFRKTDENFTNIIQKLSVQVSCTTPVNTVNFPPEMIEQAREQLDVDLTVELVIF